MSCFVRHWFFSFQRSILLLLKNSFFVHCCRHICGFSIVFLPFHIFVLSNHLQRRSVIAAYGGGKWVESDIAYAKRADLTWHASAQCPGVDSHHSSTDCKSLAHDYSFFFVSFFKIGSLQLVLISLRWNDGSDSLNVFISHYANTKKQPSKTNKIWQCKNRPQCWQQMPRQCKHRPSRLPQMQFSGPARQGGKTHCVCAESNEYEI